ncbi:hypothetical protein H6G41_08930 [Tolypothrix sp. FACHB-123]|uniref:hypothetical protein n=1 Tax=Tolypothrix sp. FACHB-123 TaxID=2692868 RepID=UPI0016897D45|nr:hypothetical protein [Tolypothrix sp. FACHB-123]MBD2354751.1 hypothetical protein [Tolypothrix sp. FACHB-123]
MAEFDSPAFRSNNWSQADLAESLATQRPVSAQPINIPLGELKPNPPNSPRRMSSLERSVALQEQAARDAEFKAQRQREQARMEEVYKREQAQRDALRNRTPTAEPPTPRITDRNPAWEQPTPTSKSPTQPGTPNSAKLPPTPNSSGARPSAKINATAHPAPGVLVQELPPPITKPATMPPSSLPKPAAGIYGGAAIGAGIDAGFRIIAGQPPAQVGFGAAGNFAGSVAGAVVGSSFGPAGTFIGGAIGGFLGGMLADAIYRTAFPPSATPPSQGYTGKLQPSGRYAKPYKVQMRIVGEGANVLVVDYFILWGPIGEITITPNLVTIECHGEYLYGNIEEYKTDPIQFVLLNSPTQSFNVQRIEDVKITPLDGVFEPSTGTPEQIPSDNRASNSYFHPGNQSYAPPRGEPQAKPNPAPNNYGVGGIAPGGSPRGDKYDWMPHGFPAPRQTPNPNTNPGNLGGELPGTSPSPAPSPSGNPGINPNPAPSPSPTPSPNGGDQSFPAPVTFSTDIGPSPKPPNFGDTNAQPVPLGSGGSVTISGPSTKPPNGLPGTNKKEPTPDATSPTPKNQDPTKPLPSIPPLFIPATTPKSPTVEEIKTGVCELTAPDKCLGQPLDNIQNQGNQNSNKLDQLNALLNGLDLAGIAALNSKLDTVNTKLGEQLPGGLSGKLTRFSKWLQLDRALNLMTFAVTVHNAMMLSNEIGQTLLVAINNVLSLIGLKDDDGQAFNLGEFISNGIENLIKGIIGEENYTVLSAAFQKANRIYQATTNVLNQLMNVNSVITNALEVIGSYTGKIGNALRIWGVVGEKAYNWMNPQPSFDNKWMTKLQQLQEGANTVAMVTQIPVDGVNAVTELTNSTTELVKAVKQEPDTKDGLDVGEAAKVKADVEAGKAVSAPPSFDITDLFDGED